MGAILIQTTTWGQIPQMLVDLGRCLKWLHNSLIYWELCPFYSIEKQIAPTLHAFTFSPISSVRDAALIYPGLAHPDSQEPRGWHAAAYLLHVCILTSRLTVTSRLAVTCSRPGGVQASLTSPAGDLSCPCCSGFLRNLQVYQPCFLSMALPRP